MSQIYLEYLAFFLSLIGVVAALYFFWIGLKNQDKKNISIFFMLTLVSICLGVGTYIYSNQCPGCEFESAKIKNYQDAYAVYKADLAARNGKAINVEMDYMIAHESALAKCGLERADFKAVISILPSGRLFKVYWKDLGRSVNALEDELCYRGFVSSVRYSGHRYNRYYLHIEDVKTS